MKYYNYIDLGIVSSKKPANPHLWIETNSSGTIYLVDSSDLTKIYKTTDKGENCTQVDMDPGNVSGDGKSRLGTISALWHDRNNTTIYGVDTTTSGNISVYLWKIDYSTDTVTELDSLIGSSGISTYTAYDVFMISTRIYIFVGHWTTGGNFYQRIYEYTAGSLVQRWTSGSYGYTGTYSYAVCTTTDAYFWFSYNDGSYKVDILEFDGSTTMSVLETQTNFSSADIVQKAMSYSSSLNTLYFILEDEGDNEYYLCSYNITTDTFYQGGIYDIVLMLDRNCASGISAKAYDRTQYKVYQLHPYDPYQIYLISNVDTDTIIKGTTDTFLINDDGDVFEYADCSEYIIKAEIHHSRQDYPYMKMEYNSDHITIIPSMFIKIIGSYTANSSTSSDEVIFEGFARIPSQGRIQYVLVENPSIEMDEINPSGSKSGTSDQIISDINDDESPNGPSYIHDGTLSTGSSMGTIVFGGAKKYRTVLDDFAEYDYFTWYIKPQGLLDYNDGSIDSGADIRYDGSGYTDKIIKIKAWKIMKLNQVIVNGAMNLSTGEPYSGQWDDAEDQQKNGINSITIEDAQLNSNALCLTKASAIGSNDTERIRAQFGFRKTIYGFIQPGQTITFKYTVSGFMTIPEAQYILDRLIYDVKSEIGYAEISSGL